MACDEKRHKEHICVLTVKGELDLVHALTLQPTIECGKCGAKASDPDLVCDPVQLPDVGWMGDGADVKL